VRRRRGRNPPSAREPGPQPDRRLRVGYVSGDFREHPVARFILPVLGSATRRHGQVVAYSDVTTPDAVTRLAPQHVDRWRDVAVARRYAQLADVVRPGSTLVTSPRFRHTRTSRAAQAAPVQITYLAYCSTRASTRSTTE